MILYPAIDIKGGKCVRLLRGNMDQATIFNDNPVDQAECFARQGCEWLHVVDLDGAVLGWPVNRSAVEAILTAVEVPVQLGGGIRDLTILDRWMEAGVARAVLGTMALRDPGLVLEACRRYPGRIAVGIDARDGMVAIEGWARTCDVSAVDLARKLEDAGVTAIVYTDIDRDGALGGVNIEATVALAQAIATPVIASGGVSSLADLLALKQVCHAGIAGAISGRALYDGRLDLASALAALKE